MSNCHSQHCHADDCLCALEPVDAEKRRLSHSAIACRVADAFVAIFHVDGDPDELADYLRECLLELEVATDDSPLRKVKP